LYEVLEFAEQIVFGLIYACRQNTTLRHEICASLQSIVHWISSPKTKIIRFDTCSYTRACGVVWPGHGREPRSGERESLGCYVDATCFRGPLVPKLSVRQGDRGYYVEHHAHSINGQEKPKGG